ncbi:hypothetical protein NS303_11290 [Pantoea ananatis]|jgi:hypothetical protein|uniref:Uncharacterized protein n=1 Tax=Pantoea ananas TaxID=553 RepID=A0AAJ1FV75_PANAN|nr:hypothetical protein [Pantoea ananatis]AWQ19721.1 hypothetical protein C1N63_13310 [Pantoea ananatis]KGL55634.1 hypothetical protein KR94_10510 [Pantoea ananatis]KTR48388.1 hypothetical protein NS303_11290 [Pantoea ananatis]KTR57622.1 hypothetical protein NS311_01730 [Pantoea ananatis]KTR63277.1 hypothetical protein RSA47_17540 [Pantoea ananatis]
MSVRIECDVAQDETDCAKLATIIERNILKITDSLVGDLHWYSANAILVPGSLRVIAVEMTETNRFKLLYDFQWNLFNPCLDLNEIVTQNEHVSFRICPAALVFEPIENQRPSPGDEL